MGLTLPAGRSSPSFNIRCKETKCYGKCSAKSFDQDQILLKVIQITLIISAFPWPATANIQFSALLIIGNVSVILLGGGLGESVMGAIHTDVSSNNRWPGNKEHVCPSGPMPKRRAWKRGRLSGAKNGAIFRM